MDIEKVNDFNFLSEEVEEFTSWWSQRLVNVRSLVTLTKKPSSIMMRHKQIIYSVFHSSMVMC